MEKWNCLIKNQKMANTLEAWAQSTDLVLPGKKCAAFIEREYELGHCQWDQQMHDLIMNQSFDEAVAGLTSSPISSTDPRIKPEKVMVDEILNLLFVGINGC